MASRSSAAPAPQAQGSPSRTVRTFSTVQLTPGVRGYNIVDGDDVLGGEVRGLGVQIDWQDGPAGALREGLNGAFVEDVIEAAIERIECYETTKFACDENKAALHFLRQGLAALRGRMADRRQAGKLGENKV